MISSKRLRILWLAAFSLLVAAQALHQIYHLELLHEAAHAHHHDHSHGPDHSGSGDVPEHCHLGDHCHSPAIVEGQSFFSRHSVGCFDLAADPLSLDPPVQGIDHPPQLS